MKTKIKKGSLRKVVRQRVLLWMVFCFIGTVIGVLVLDPFVSAEEHLALAQEFDGEAVEADGDDGPVEGPVQYKGFFTISAYYSPLPCQKRYATGSYEGDVRLNGEGVHSADGSRVYPGMIAAPRSYPFGTKMNIPGVGMVAVHDRGGAIISGGEGYYDRLDVWMGYGDKGLKRALRWGRRTLEVMVYGVNEQIVEEVTLDGYSAEEGASCGNDNSEATVAEETVPEAPVGTENPSELVVENPLAETASEVSPVTVAAPVAASEMQNLVRDLKFGDSGPEVLALQNELARLNLFKTEFTGYYGEVTQHAVFKFQQIQGLVLDKNSAWAGIFGPKTRDRMNEIIASRSYIAVRVAEASNNFQKLAADSRRRLITINMNFGSRGEEVAMLQKFLRKQGFFEGGLVTEYFGPITKEAVIKFQLANGIIKNENDLGAGVVGPATMEMINWMS